MAKLVNLSSDLEAPELQIYRTLRRPEEHLRQRIFVAEGESVVRRLLRSSLRVRSLLLTPEWREKLSDETRLMDEDLTIYIAPKDSVETIVGYNLHQGIMAIGEMPAEPSIDGVLASLKHPGLIVALDGLVNSENVGVIVRNCAAFGVDLIIAGETSSSPWLRRSVRNSMGAIFTLPVVHSSNLAVTIGELRAKQYDVMAATPEGSASIYETAMTGNCCIVLGNEGDGISSAIMDACSQRVSIPMANNTDSINVANACAVFLAEAVRQRRTAQGSTLKAQG